MNSVKPLLIVAIAAVLIAAPAASQETVKVKEVADGMFRFTPSTGGDEIVTFLKILAEETGASVVYDPASPQVRGRKIELEGPAIVDETEIFDWVRSILSFQRLVLVPTGPRHANTWMLLDINSPAVTNHPEYVPADELLDWEDRDGAYIVSTLTLEHITDTARARNALAQLSTRQIGRINDVPQTRCFIIADFAPVVVSAWRLLQRMDEEFAKTPPEEREKLDPRVRQTTPQASRNERTLEVQIEKYEQRLMSAQTPHAAQYFLSRILELTTKLEKERVEEANAAAAAAAKEKAAAEKQATPTLK